MHWCSSHLFSACRTHHNKCTYIRAWTLCRRCNNPLTLSQSQQTNLLFFNSVTLWFFTTYLVITFYLSSFIENLISLRTQETFLDYYRPSLLYDGRRALVTMYHAWNFLSFEYKQSKIYLNYDLSLNAEWMTPLWGPRPPSLWLPCLKILCVVAVNPIQVSATTGVLSYLIHSDGADIYTLSAAPSSRSYGLFVLGL